MLGDGIGLRLTGKTRVRFTNHTRSCLPTIFAHRRKVRVVKPTTFVCTGKRGGVTVAKRKAVCKPPVSTRVEGHPGNTSIMRGSIP